MRNCLLAEFKTARELTDAARAAAAAGLPAQDALCPNPVEGVVGYLAPPPAPSPIGWIMFAAGVFGALAGYFMQWYSAVIDYPINSGGRPLNSWPAFLLVPYETTILAAAVIGVLAWLWLCSLPKLFHPLFAAPIVERASQDRYLLVFPKSEKVAAWIRSNYGRGALHEEEP